MARHHGHVFTESVPEAEIAALVDPDAANLARFLGAIFPDKKNVPPTLSDYRDMLAKVPLDGVVIISPHIYHFAQAMDSINAGCHVLVEKPMVICTPDAQALIEHARMQQKVVSVAFPGPFSPEFQYIRDVIARGELGVIYLVTGLCAQPWLSFVGGTWCKMLELSGCGNMYDCGEHMFNTMM